MEGVRGALSRRSRFGRVEISVETDKRSSRVPRIFSFSDRSLAFCSKKVSPGTPANLVEFEEVGLFLPSKALYFSRSAYFPSIYSDLSEGRRGFGGYAKGIGEFICVLPGG